MVRKFWNKWFQEMVKVIEVTWQNLTPFILLGYSKIIWKYNKTCDDFEDEVNDNTSKWKNFNNSCDNKDFTDKFLWVTPGTIKKADNAGNTCQNCSAEIIRSFTAQSGSEISFDYSWYGSSAGTGITKISTYIKKNSDTNWTLVTEFGGSGGSFDRFNEKINDYIISNNEVLDFKILVNFGNNNDYNNYTDNLKDSNYRFAFDNFCVSHSSSQLLDDDDFDNDGIKNDIDNCQLVYNPSQEDEYVMMIMS